MRVDIQLRDTLSLDRPLTAAHPARWARWARECSARLDSIEPLVGADGPDTGDRISGWQGALRLTALEISAWQGIDIPRQWDDPRREPDPSPDQGLDAMLERTRGALHAWMECLDHLVPPRR